MTSSATSGSTPPRKVKKNARINDAALDPAVGSLRCRLDAFMSHCPMHFEGKRAGKCQLHRWARERKGKEVRNAKVLYCSGCNVSLCSKCWNIFHNKDNLVAMKNKIAES